MMENNTPVPLEGQLARPPGIPKRKPVNRKPVPSNSRPSDAVPSSDLTWPMADSEGVELKPSSQIPNHLPELKNPEPQLSQKSPELEAMEFTVQVLSRSIRLDHELYLVPGVNQAIDLSRKTLVHQQEALRAYCAENPEDFQMCMNLATSEGEAAALDAFDSSGPDHWTFSDVSSAFKFPLVRHYLTRLQSEGAYPSSPSLHSPRDRRSFSQGQRSPDGLSPRDQAPEYGDSSSFSQLPLPPLPPRPSQLPQHEPLVDGTQSTQPLSYVKPMVHYVGDGALAANAALATTALAMNNHIWAHNRRVEGPPTGQVASYDFRKKGAAIYTAPLAEYGLSRAEFESIVDRAEVIRQVTKKELDKKWLAAATALTAVSFGIASFMFVGNIHKKSGAAMKPVELYFEGVNRSMREKQIPLVWEIKIAPFFMIEVTITHSPL